MTKIFKNMAPYWYMIVAIVLLLIVQAFGDLSLPQYTSDIIDVGIQNKGVEHILPVKMTEDEYVQFVASSKVTVEFAADKNTATVTYDQGPGEVGGQGIFVVLYKIKGTAIVFYDSQEDMEKEIPAHKYGLIAGSTFELSADKTTIIQTNIEPDLGTYKFILKVAQ